MAYIRSVMQVGKDNKDIVFRKQKEKDRLNQSFPRSSFDIILPFSSSRGLSSVNRRWPAVHAFTLSRTSDYTVPKQSNQAMWQSDRTVARSPPSIINISKIYRNRTVFFFIYVCFCRIGARNPLSPTVPNGITILVSGYLSLLVCRSIK